MVVDLILTVAILFLYFHSLLFSSPRVGPGMVNGDPNMQQPNFPFFGGGPEPGPAGAVSSVAPSGALTTSTSGAGGQFNLSSVNSPHPPLDLAGPGSVNATGFSPRPISSVESKQDLKQTISKLLSPTSGSFSPSSTQNQGSSDPLLQAGGLPSLPSMKNEPLTSPTFSGGPTSIPNPPQSQTIKTELNSISSGDISSTLNVPEVPPLPDSLPSVPNTHTPAAGELFTLFALHYHNYACTECVILTCIHVACQLCSCIMLVMPLYIVLAI